MEENETEVTEITAEETTEPSEIEKLRTELLAEIAALREQVNERTARDSDTGESTQSDAGDGTVTGYSPESEETGPPPQESDRKPNREHWYFRPLRLR